MIVDVQRPVALGSQAVEGTERRERPVTSRSTQPVHVARRITPSVSLSVTLRLPTVGLPVPGPSTPRTDCVPSGAIEFHAKLVDVRGRDVQDQVDIPDQERIRDTKS